MARRNRDNLKRKCAQVYFELDRAMADALELKVLFDEHHPELGAVLEVVAAVCLQNQALLTRFWTEAWGQETIRWESWI
uniref:Uncharacterized protein n=1 Tax=viral metagenome TaxID=1070528 RepID=A0A6M3Y1V8_9ZZZZ